MVTVFREYCHRYIMCTKKSIKTNKKVLLSVSTVKNNLQREIFMKRD